MCYNGVGATLTAPVPTLYEAILEKFAKSLFFTKKVQLHYNATERNRALLDKTKRNNATGPNLSATEQCDDTLCDKT